ncbi:MAG: deoxyhypusine synthase family protein, partial [bacterium]
QVGPYLEISAERLGLDQPVRRYKYAVRICPEPVHWGGLSGCSYTEGVSWGKFVPEAEGGCFAEVFADATIAWPLIVRSVMERTSGYGRLPDTLWAKLRTKTCSKIYVPLVASRNGSAVSASFSSGCFSSTRFRSHSLFASNTALPSRSS